VSKRVLSVALVLGLMTLVACGSNTPSAQAVKTRFVPQTVDFLDDVGRGASIALDKDQNPHIAYIGLIPPPQPGVIPPARPSTAPALPAVLIATQANGIFNQGFVAQTDITTSKPVPVPVTTDSTTGIAINDAGAMDVVWNQFGSKPGVYFATAPNGAAPFGDPIQVTASSATSPAVTTDAKGNPVVVFVTTNASGAPVVDQATLDSNGKSFTITQIDLLTACQGTCPAASVAAAVGPNGPVVAFNDPGTGDVDMAEQSGTGWTVHQVEKGVGAYGVSIAPGASGRVLVGYLTDSDARVASGSSPFTTWTNSHSPSFSGGRVVAGDATSVSQANGTTYLAYTDPADGTIRLDQARGTGSLAQISTPGTANGLFPALAVTNHNHVQLAWYNSLDQDLLLGLYPETLGALALPPSPIPYTPPGGGPSGTCGKGTVEVIAPVGAAGAGFKTPSVTATSGDFQLCFNNEDAGVTHNVAIFKDQAAATSGAPALASDTPFAGPKLDTFSVKGLSPGSYYFHCDVHPGTMTGTLTVK
jgi:plastocyanin